MTYSLTGKSGKWRQTRYKLTDDKDKAHRWYGEGNYERRGWTREVRTGARAGEVMQ
ncbi:MAG: hypothetical protein JWN94_4900 [Betaproteobacteria bacterium]|nr:hypothetical protein [Betaproteobacteria bacterium]